MNAVAERLQAVQERIEKAAKAAGRGRDEVRLVAVSKGQSPEQIRQAYEAGQRVFGENYAQELAAKAEALADLKGLEWHFIGHFQTNKAKIIAKHACFVHSIGSSHAASALGKRVQSIEGAPMPVLIEVNLGRGDTLRNTLEGEPQRYGAAPHEIEEVIAAVQAEPGLALRGLMTLPLTPDRSVARKAFETLATLRVLHGGSAVLPELSMGMSGDLEEAIAAGATLVRVGTAIFGHRGG